jgi:hypothetical protein
MSLDVTMAEEPKAPPTEPAPRWVQEILYDIDKRIIEAIRIAMEYEERQRQEEDQRRWLEAPL